MALSTRGLTIVDFQLPFLPSCTELGTGVASGTACLPEIDQQRYTGDFGVKSIMSEQRENGYRTGRSNTAIEEERYDRLDDMAIAIEEETYSIEIINQGSLGRSSVKDGKPNGPAQLNEVHLAHLHYPMYRQARKTSEMDTGLYTRTDTDNESETSYASCSVAVVSDVSEEETSDRDVRGPPSGLQHLKDVDGSDLHVFHRIYQWLREAHGTYIAQSYNHTPYILKKGLHTDSDTDSNPDSDAYPSYDAKRVDNNSKQRTSGIEDRGPSGLVAVGSPAPSIPPNMRIQPGSLDCLFPKTSPESKGTVLNTCLKVSPSPHFLMAGNQRQYGKRAPFMMGSVNTPYQKARVENLPSQAVRKSCDCPQRRQLMRRNRQLQQLRDELASQLAYQREREAHHSDTKVLTSLDADMGTDQRVDMKVVAEISSSGADESSGEELISPCCLPMDDSLPCYGE
mgnify:CR=1 FL=1